jgi:gamma-glutamyltranspeptidase/glutathione hydrolase
MASLRLPKRWEANSVPAMIHRLLHALILTLALSACATVQTHPLANTAAPSEATPFRKGMVSAADPRAAEAGAEMLRRGGSATDAAIATMLALTVVEPQSSGIGGGGFYVRGTLEGDVETLDGRETAPAGATPDWFLDEAGKPLPFRDAVLSGLSVGVPGNVALAALAHRRHGKLAWPILFEPAIRLAREGWTLTDRFHEFLTLRPQSARHDPAGKALFFDESGKPLPVGTKLSNPALADTLERIADKGPDAFYSEPHSAALSAKVAAATPARNAMTMQDVSSYRAKERPPVCGMYRAYRICGMGPPSSGATTVLAILGQLEMFDMGSLTPDAPQAWHLFAESQRLAYADRERFLADTDFVSVPVEKLIERAYLARRGSLIQPDTTLEEVSPGLEMPPPDGAEPPENGTSHFAVIDREGNAVSYTSTIESAFGSGLMIGGFYLNNELTDFSFVPEKDGQPVANRVEGGKRPRSSMAPTLVYGPDGKLTLAIGAAGGSTIPVQVARALIGFIDWKMPIDEALALPVLFSPGDVLIVEEGSELEALIPALKALGHGRIMTRRLPVKTNAVVSGDALAGAADPRSEGRAISE